MKKKFTDYEIEENTSGGAVFEAGVKESKRSKAVRIIAQPLMDKYWKDRGQDVTTLHRVYKVAEYLLKRKTRHK